MHCQLFDFIQNSRQLQFIFGRQPFFQIMGTLKSTPEKSQCNALLALARLKGLHLIIKDAYLDSILIHHQNKNTNNDRVRTPQIYQIYRCLQQITTSYVSMFSQEIDCTPRHESTQYNQQKMFPTHKSKIFLCSNCQFMFSIYMEPIVDKLQTRLNLQRWNGLSSIIICPKVSIWLDQILGRPYKKLFSKLCQKSAKFDQAYELLNKHRLQALDQMIQKLTQSVNQLNSNQYYKNLIRQQLLSNKKIHRQLWSKNEPIELKQRHLKQISFQFLNSNFTYQRKISSHETQQYFSFKSKQWFSHALSQNLTEYFLNDKTGKVSYVTYPSQQIMRQEYTPYANLNLESNVSIAARLNNEQSRIQRQINMTINRQEDQQPFNRRRLN